MWWNININQLDVSLVAESQDGWQIMKILLWSSLEWEIESNWWFGASELRWNEENAVKSLNRRKKLLAEQLKPKVSLKVLIKLQRLFPASDAGVDFFVQFKNLHQTICSEYIDMETLFVSVAPAKSFFVFALKIWLQRCYFQCLNLDVLCNWNGFGEQQIQQQPALDFESEGRKSCSRKTGIDQHQLYLLFSPVVDGILLMLGNFFALAFLPIKFKTVLKFYSTLNANLWALQVPTVLRRGADEKYSFEILPSNISHKNWGECF